MHLSKTPANQSLHDLLLISSHNLSGECGQNRSNKRPCQIDAQNDLEAIQCWLKEYAHKNQTHRAYQKEAERLLLWSVLQKNKPLSSLNRQDFDDYLEFIKDPSPRDFWCGPKGSRNRKRYDLSWRPFVGPLSASAQMLALTILDSMMQYLVAASYLDFNPLSLMRRKKSQLYRTNSLNLKLHERMLDDEEWGLLLTTLKNLPELTAREKDEKARLRFLVAILFLLGLRINELETHNWNAFKLINNDWWFFVTGKGDKPGKIPVNSDLIFEITSFRRHLRLADFPTPHEETPIIPSWHGNKSLSSRQMSNLLKKLAARTALNPDIAPERKIKLHAFSPHWIRHLSASMQDRVGISFGHIKANHRHESDETTRRYVHAFDKERHEDMKKLKLF